MANSRKLDNELRGKYLSLLMDFCASNNEDVLRTGSNDFSFPTLDSEGNEKWIQVVIKVPSGARDEKVFDGYGMAESYQLKVKEKEEKEKEKAKEKEKKIARDKKRREKEKEEKGE